MKSLTLLFTATLLGAIAVSTYAASPGAVAKVAPESGGPQFQRMADAPDVIPGFVGPYLNASAVTGKVEVVSASVHVIGTHPLKVAGLIRNQTDHNVKVGSLVANLVGPLGQVLGAETAWLPVTELRPGEPAPFVVTSSLPAAINATINYAVSIDSAKLSAGAKRGLDFDIYWERAYGTDDARHGYPQDDAGAGPYPYVLFGAVSNIGFVDLLNTKVLAAWLDDDGSVVNVDWVTLRTGDFKTPMAAVALPRGAVAHLFYATADPALGPHLNDQHIALWGVAK